MNFTVQFKLECRQVFCQQQQTDKIDWLRGRVVGFAFLEKIEAANANLLWHVGNGSQIPSFGNKLDSTVTWYTL